MNHNNSNQSCELKKFVKPQMSIIDMTPCSIVALSDPDFADKSETTGTYSPSAGVDPMTNGGTSSGWGDW